MERLNFASSSVINQKLEDGTKIRAQKTEIKRKIPGSVAEHEAAHVVAAGNIVSATIIPSGEALGTTVPVKMTAAAAAAAEALGYSGTSWDMHVAEHYLGTDPQTAKSAARAALAGKEAEMHEVASLLQERKNITQTDVLEARQNVKNKNQGVFPVEVQIESPGMQTIKLNTESFHHEVKIADLITK